LGEEKNKKEVKEMAGIEELKEAQRELKTRLAELGEAEAVKRCETAGIEIKNLMKSVNSMTVDEQLGKVRMVNLALQNEWINRPSYQGI